MSVFFVCVCIMRVFSLLLRCVKTFQESFKSLAIIPTKNKTEPRVDGAIGDGQNRGNFIVESYVTIPSAPIQHQ